MKIHYKLGKLFDIDNILWIITVRVDDFSTASHLGEDYILLTPLLIGSNVRYSTMAYNRVVSTNYSITILTGVK